MHYTALESLFSFLNWEANTQNKISSILHIVIENFLMPWLVIPKVSSSVRAKVPLEYITTIWDWASKKNNNWKAVLKSITVRFYEPEYETLEYSVLKYKLK